MKPENITSLMVSFLFFVACSPNKTTHKNQANFRESNTVLREDFQKHFDSCGVDGSIAIYDYHKNRWIVSDTVKIKIETLPASTFKILNLLILLESKTISDEDEVVSWVGSTDTVKYGYRPEIYHNMPVKEAFELSAGWVFVELAKKIGKDKYREYLAKCKYGNNDLSQQETDFWNYGNFAISPINQVEFLHSLYEEKLPFSKRTIGIVKKAMITEKTEDYIIRAKTVWTRENNTNTGWWTGYNETKNGTFIFATRLLQDRKYKRSDFGTCRKDITKKIFKELKIIE